MRMGDAGRFAGQWLTIRGRTGRALARSRHLWACRWIGPLLEMPWWRWDRTGMEGGGRVE